MASTSALCDISDVNTPMWGIYVILTTMAQTTKETARDKLGEVEVLYEDNHLLVLAKPHGLLTQASVAEEDCLLFRAKEYVRVLHRKPGQVYMGLVHRLDRNVSGAVVLARTSKAASRLSEAFRSRRVSKVYLAVVEGEIPVAGRLQDHVLVNPKGRGVQRGDGGKEAVLEFKRLGLANGRSLVEVTLLTGRKHQIRAQLSWAGHPIVGDPLYGQRVKEILRPALHGRRLTIEHPVKKISMTFKALVPKDMSELMKDFLNLDSGLVV